MAHIDAHRRIVATPIDRRSFRAFGDVIDTRDNAGATTINEGNASRHDDLARLDLAGHGGRARASIFKSRPVVTPWTVRVMECHPLGTQLFMPLGYCPYLVIVAPPGPFDPDSVRAFVASGGQGVNYLAGVWHHYLLALREHNGFLVVDRAGPGTATEETTLDEPIVVALPDNHMHEEDR